MTYLAGGHEIGFCTPSSGAVHEVTAALHSSTAPYDSNTSRCALGIGLVDGDTSSYAEWSLASSTTTPNIGFMGYGARPNFGGTYDWVLLCDSGGTAKAKVTVQRFDSTGTFDTYVKLWYLSGTSWVEAGANAIVNMGVLTKFDVALNAAGSGSFQLFASKTLVIDSGTIDLSGVGSIAKVRVKATYGDNYVSEMIISTASTVRLRGYTRYPISDASAGWTSGTYADVDEIVYSDVDGLQSASANQVSTVNGSSTTLGGFAVEAVLVGARAALGTSGPTKIDLAINSASDNTNHFTSDISLTAGYTANVGIWATDPGSSAAWTSANATGSKFGVKSIT